MSISVSMPQLGESVTEGTIGRWLKSVGDHVDLDEPIVEIITDKVNVEVPSPAAGVVVLIVVAEGQTVAVGSQIAIIDEATSASSTNAGTLKAGNQAASASTATGTLHGPTSPAASTPDATIHRADSAEPNDRIGTRSAPARSHSNTTSTSTRTTPLVRRLVEEHEIDLGHVVGTGLGGRISRDDILGYLSQRGIIPTPIDYQARTSGGYIATSTHDAPAVKREIARTTARISASHSSSDTWLPLSPRRRAIAENTLLSATNVPHARVSYDIDMTGVSRARSAAKDDFRRREGFDLSFLPFVACAVVESLRQHAHINVAYETNSSDTPGVRTKSRVHLSLAVGLNEGLMVPVIREADGLSIAGLARAANDLFVRAREGRLMPHDIAGGTFTLNNTGALGSIASDPILNSGQAAIMTMEAIVRRPVVVTRDGEEAIVVRSMMMSVLTFDHRVLDGLQAGEFMRSVKKHLESIGTATSIY